MLLHKCHAYLNTSDLQFGFKKGVGCSDALYTLKSVVDYYVRNDNTIVLSVLDISKAFDKVSHFQLYTKLMERNVPKCLIQILICWYSKCSVFVRWGSVVSSCFSVSAGVRQGGVLSPV